MTSASCSTPRTTRWPSTSTNRLRAQLPNEPGVIDQIIRDVSNSTQLAAAQAAEQKDWARSLELLMHAL